MLIYLSGPMRGRPNCNFAAFDDAKRRWAAAGHKAFSPACLARAAGIVPSEDDDPNSPSGRTHPRYAIQVDMACLYAADAIALLPGWESSAGATVELAMALFLGLPVYDAVSMGLIDPDRRPWAEIRDYRQYWQPKTGLPYGITVAR